MLTILLLSAGSLLGQNILDALEHRRNNVRIIGMDADPSSSRIFRCDKVYESPLTIAADFEAFLLKVVEAEKVQLILPGGDQDVLFLSQFKEKHPHLASLLPVGSHNAAMIINDKALSHTFALKHQLPFAKSLVLETAELSTALQWAAEVTYPLIAKPRRGYGSHGVKFVVDSNQLEALLSANKEQYILQELLDYDQTVKDYIVRFQEQSTYGIPLFIHLPDHFEYTAQTCILPDGSHDELFTTITSMIMGRCEKSTYFKHDDFSSVASRFANALAEEGWRGMLNLQAKKTPRGYVVYEMNGRMSGSTSAREMVGYDEIGLVAHHFCGYVLASEATRSRTEGYVYRSLTDYYVSNEALQELRSKHVWEKTEGGGR